MAKYEGFNISKTRLSLAYGFVNHIPSKVIARVRESLQWLDLSHNEFQKLAFLEQLPELRTLILDGNCQLDCSTMPMMENLCSLFLNNCNLINIPEWLSVLQEKCPNLEVLSMECNPVGKTVLNETQERRYRKQFIRALPCLRYFDGVAVTKAERRNALKSIGPSLGKVVRQKLNQLNCMSSGNL